MTTEKKRAVVNWTILGVFIACVLAIAAGTREHYLALGQITKNADVARDNRALANECRAEIGTVRKECSAMLEGVRLELNFQRVLLERIATRLDVETTRVGAHP